MGVWTDVFRWVWVLSHSFVSDNGGIHKVVKSGSQSFVIAEYQPFSQRDHVLNIVLHPSTVSKSAAYTVHSTKTQRLDCEGILVISHNYFYNYNS